MLLQRNSGTAASDTEHRHFSPRTQLVESSRVPRTLVARNQRHRSRQSVHRAGNSASSQVFSDEGACTEIALIQDAYIRSCCALKLSLPQPLPSEGDARLV